MNDLLAPLRSYLASRSPRERWLLVAGACALALVIVYSAIVVPLDDRAREADRRVAQLELELIRAIGIAGEMRALQGERELVGLMRALADERRRLEDKHGRRVPLAVKIAPDLDGTQIASNAFGTDKHGLSFGAQMESWW